MAQKLHLVEVYNRRLDERERRKAFVLDRGLLNVRKQQVGLLFLGAWKMAFSSWAGAC